MSKQGDIDITGGKFGATDIAAAKFGDVDIPIGGGGPLLEASIFMINYLNFIWGYESSNGFGSLTPDTINWNGLNDLFVNGFYASGNEVKLEIENTSPLFAGTIINIELEGYGAASLPFLTYNSNLAIYEVSESALLNYIKANTDVNLQFKIISITPPLQL